MPKWRCDDGANIKQAGQQSWSSNINDQINDAERLLKQFSFNHFVMTRGSGYHVQRDATNYEEILAGRLNSCTLFWLFFW